MMRPRVLLDCDGVLSDFVSAYLAIVRSVTGRSYTPEQVTRFDIAASLGLSKEESRACGDAIGEEFCARLEPTWGSTNGVRRLREIADVYIVTSPWWSCATWMYERQQWLHVHHGIPASRVVHTSAKHLLRGDFLVDDKTSTLIEWQAANPDGAAIQWQTPHNRLDGWTGLSTCSWDELIAAVSGPAHFACSPEECPPPSDHPDDTPPAVTRAPAMRFDVGDEGGERG